MSAQHKFSVSQSFAGVGITIVVSLDDLPRSFPLGTQGAVVASASSRAGKVARETMFNKLADVADTLTGALIVDYQKARAERDELATRSRDEAVSKAREQVLADATEATRVRVSEVRAEADTRIEVANAAAEAARAETQALKDEIRARDRAKRRAAALKGRASRARK